MHRVTNKSETTILVCELQRGLLSITPILAKSDQFINANKELVSKPKLRKFPTISLTGKTLNYSEDLVAKTSAKTSEVWQIAKKTGSWLRLDARNEG